MKLPRSTYAWALKHLQNEGDTDLFPAPLEIQALVKHKKLVLDQLENLNIEDYEWSKGRRFVVPKDVLSFRIATQLDPLDSLIVAALIRKYGARLEKTRVESARRQVFSYRFAPTADGRFYGASSTWHDFWRRSLDLASKDDCRHVVVADITDYYNQIYHHVLENQLRDSGLPKEIFRSLKSFIGTMTETVSRGIPVGPHSVHLLAEIALNVLDYSLVDSGYEFCRYVDDIHVFCTSQQLAEGAVYDLAAVLDDQQRLTLNRQKTKIMTAAEFCALASSMLVDRPASAEEEEVLEVISRHSNDDPYRWISLAALTSEDLRAVSQDILERLLSTYLGETPLNYPRLGWLLRRLTQIAAPGAIDFVLSHLRELAPVFGEAARYLLRASSNYVGDMTSIGERLLSAMDLPLVAKSDYLQIVLFDIFGRVPALDHISKITVLYEKASNHVKPQIVLAAAGAGRSTWLRGRKDDFHHGDAWLRRALLIASVRFPGDEPQHWISSVKRRLNGLEKLAVMWAYGDKSPKLGDIKLV